MDFLTANDSPGEHAPSWYAATANPEPAAPPLEGETRADICIIGAGFTGLSAALHLAQRGYNVVLLDAHKPGWGASGRNGGQVGSGQRVDQDQLEKMFGGREARKLWDMAEEAKSLVAGLIETHRIDCAPCPGILDAHHRKGGADEMRAYADYLQDHCDYQSVRFVARDELQTMLGTTAYDCGLLDEGGFHIHPLNFALGLARAAKEAGVRVHGRSRVMSIERGDPALIKTEHGLVRAAQIIVACNGYLGTLLPETAARVMPINNYIVATEPLGPDKARELIRDNVAVADSKFVVNYFRLSADHRLLFGGTESYSYRFPRDIAAAVRRPMLKIYPQLKDIGIEYAWGGTLGITMQRLPHFARITPNILSLSGYSGHGVALSTLAGKIAAEAIAGQAERFDIFERLPTPPFPGGIGLRPVLLKLAMTWYALRDRL